jgi:diadenosine tetraphosphate (Ap4A) HIT family hydrolase
MKSFVLHARLAADTAEICDFALSRVLLMDDARFPWVILVPRYASAIEITDLSESDRSVLIEEVARSTRVLRKLNGIEKINVGALGNVVSQLHVHVVARHAKDAAWPGPVWGSGQRVPYAQPERDRLVKVLAQELRN